MTSTDDRAGRAEDGKDYRALPPEVRVEDMVVGVEAAPPPDPDAGRNLDQHRALRDD